MNPRTIAFFDTKPYDREFFDQANQKYGFNIKYFNVHYVLPYLGAFLTGIHSSQ